MPDTDPILKSHKWPCLQDTWKQVRPVTNLESGTWVRVTEAAPEGPEWPSHMTLGSGEWPPVASNGYPVLCPLLEEVVA